MKKMNVVNMNPGTEGGDGSVLLKDIESLQNRLLKVCYVLATSPAIPRVIFFFSFLFLLLGPLTVLMKQTRQAAHAVKQSMFLDVYGFTPVLMPLTNEVNRFLIFTIAEWYSSHGKDIHFCKDK
jgi:hypothetical protein